MEQYVIRGGTPLEGEVVIAGAKNAALGILAAAFEQSGYGTLLDGEINEDYIRIVYSLSDTYLQLLEDTFKEAINSSDTSLKTNSGKNKYIVVSDGNDFYMKKL